MPTLTNDLARLANSANVLVSAITVNSSAITSVNVGGVSINSSGLGGGPVTFSNNVTINGNLVVTGTTVTVNTTTLDVKDLNITIAKGAASAAAANGAGITVDGASATLNYDSSIDDWVSNKGFKATDLTLTTNTATIGTATYFVANGSVGIGNSTPAHKVSVGGTGYFGDTVSIAGSLSVGTTDFTTDLAYVPKLVVSGVGPVLYLRETDGDDWSLSALSNNFSIRSVPDIANSSTWTVPFFLGTGAPTSSLYVASNGNVGIGTSSPATKLDVVGSIVSRLTSSGYSGIFPGDPTNTGYFAAWDASGVRQVYSGYVTSDAVYATWGETNKPMLFGTSSNERMRITSIGQVGIGTTNPRPRFEIAGSAVTMALTNTDATANNKTWDIITGATSIGIRTVNDAYSAAATAYVIARANNTVDAHAWYTGTNTERMRIDNAGNIGIGATTNAAWRLNVDSSGVFGSILCNSSSDTTNPIFGFSKTRAGNASVVNGDIFGQILFSGWNGTSNGGPRITAVASGAISSTSLQSDLFFSTVASGSTLPTERMRITSAGNVGIGTSSPGQTLHVVGTGFASSDLRAPIFYDSDNTNYYINAAGYSKIYDVNVDSGYIYFQATQHKRITSNDGAGNWNFRAGNVVDGTLKYINNGVANSGAATITLTCDGAAGYISFLTAPIGANGATVTYSGSAYLDSLGTFGTNGDFRAPIFYDSNNTAFYIDAASTSVLNAATFAGVHTVNASGITTTANVNIGAAGELVIAAGAGIFANGGLGSAGEVLHSNGSSIYWATDDQGVTSVSGTSGRITSSGGTTPAIDLATAGAGAASYSSGISALTVDAYGRVTSVTGSAGYITSSGSITGSAYFGFVQDTRNSVTGPNLGDKRVRWDFLLNSTDGLSDGGSYHGVMTFQQWTDGSGGGTRQLGFTDNDNLWIRGSGSGVTSYGSWKRFWHNSDSTISASGDFRAPIFYDSNNTAYYVDPTSTSVFAGQIQSRSGATASFYVVDAAGASSYNYIMGAANDTGNKLVMFVNGSSRTADGGVNTVTIRNDGGPLNLGNLSTLTTLNGSSVYSPRNIYFDANSGYGINLNGTSTDMHRIYLDGFWTIFKSHSNEGWQFRDNGNNIRARIYGNSGRIDAPSLYDSDNTGFYVDPAGTSRLNNIDNNMQLFGGYGSGSGPGLTFENQSTFIRFAFWDLDFYDWNVGSVLRLNSFAQSDTSMRSPIFYDSNDTNWYVDPNGYSRLSGIINVGSSGNWNTDFQNTPHAAFRYVGDLNSGTNCPTGGGWWVQQNFRHSNSSNFWGVQVAWGWEDRANELYTRNVSGGGYGSWIRYWNSANAPGAILQVQQTHWDGVATLAAGSFTNHPNLSVSITPRSSSSRILIMVSMQATVYNLTTQVRFTRNDTPIGIAAAASNRVRSTFGALQTIGDGNHQFTPWNFQYIDSPGTTSALTYRVQLKMQSSTTAYLNRSFNDADNTDWAQRTTSTITVMEIAA